MAFAVTENDFVVYADIYRRDTLLDYFPDFLQREKRHAAVVIVVAAAAALCGFAVNKDYLQENGGNLVIQKTMPRYDDFTITK